MKKHIVWLFVVSAVWLGIVGCPCRRCAAVNSPMRHWDKLKNPIYAVPNWSVKDACMIEKDGVFYLFFSAFYFDRGQERSHVVGVKTTDFIDYSPPLFIWDGTKDDWIGLCSPDIIYADGKYVLTYNSWGDKKDKPNQLFYAISNDLECWQAGLPLAANLTTGKRAIDAALAFYNGWWILMYKEGSPGKARIAASKQLDGGWEFIGEGFPTFHRLAEHPAQVQENYQFLNIDGRWHLITTDYRPHQMFIYQMGSTGERLPDWLVWVEGRPLEMPQEAFNTDHIANAGVVVDWRSKDGYFYCLYAGRTEGFSHARRGDNKLGIAASTNLVHWFAPPHRPPMRPGR